MRKTFYRGSRIIHEVVMMKIAYKGVSLLGVFFEGGRVF
jgi:hypothetical protein